MIGKKKENFRKFIKVNKRFLKNNYCKIFEITGAHKTDYNKVLCKNFIDHD